MEQNTIDKVPVKVDEIFEKLTSNNGFICSNSLEEQTKYLYNIIENNFEIIYNYFEKIGFILKKGEGFFYFSKDYKTNDDRKIEKFYNYIDILDFFKNFNSIFSTGFTFSPANIAQKCEVDLNLKEKLNNIKKDKSKNLIEKVRDIIKDLKNDGFLEQIKPEEEEYKVLTSFLYLENIVSIVNIEDIEDEII
jgi:Txe/YoeB family toxin of Txe-Axe toxin-antitoxin module